MASEAVLLAYQQAWLNDQAEVKVWEKSRRIGASWCDAADSALTAAAQKDAGGQDCFYIGYNKEMAEEYIRDVATWARTFHHVSLEIFEETVSEVIGDERRDILTFRVVFASGHKVVALSSRPTNLRGRQGKVTIDEAAFHNDLAGLIKAAMAFLMWGGKVAILSTHLGVENPFNELVLDIRAGRKPFSLHRTSFDDAVAAGLFRRICRRKGKAWSAQAEAAWVAEIRAFYGDDAAEELDCVPAQSKGAWLTRALIEGCMDPALPLLRWTPPADNFVDWDRDTAHRHTLDWCEANLKPLLEALPRDQRHYFGEDFGRSGDLTVLWPLSERANLTAHTPFILELRNAPFRTQEQILYYLVDRLPRFSGGALDARGNGQSLAEFARQRYGPELIAEVMLSLGWYREHMPRVKADLEDRAIVFPRHADVLDDLRGLQIVNGVAKPPDVHGKSKEGQRHCDSAVALAMAEFARATLCPPEPWATPVTKPRDYLKQLMRGY
jgi:phage FluMu gp28-like protein